LNAQSRSNGELSSCNINKHIFIHHMLESLSDKLELEDKQKEIARQALKYIFRKLHGTDGNTKIGEAYLALVIIKHPKISEELLQHIFLFFFKS
jgi:hypothetical protein